MTPHEIHFFDDGRCSCLHTDLFPLQSLGTITTRRASSVEFNEASQEWEVRFAETPEIVSFSDPSRDACLEWERAELQPKIYQ